MFVLGGYEPTVADGYVWWAASQVTNLVGGDLPAFPTKTESFSEVHGYIATSNGTRPYVEPLPLRCPATADLAHVSALLGGERAVCYGATSLTLVGTLTCGECEGIGPPETYEPYWLAGLILASLAVDPRVWFADLELHFPPEVAPDGIKEKGLYGSILRVVGHFNDPRSASCEIALYVDDDTSHPVADEYAQQACRQEFVVESFDVLGIDREYVGPYD